MPNILYATSRQQATNLPAGTIGFTDAVLAQAPDALLCGTAEITGIAIPDPSAGIIVAVTTPSQGWFSDTDLAPLLASQNDVLVFVHGAANSFQDAIKRAAYNKEWLGEAALAGVGNVCDVIAFTWPARAYTIANIVSDLIDYRHDQHEADASAFHFGLFLARIQALRAQLGHRRLNLLCHSMGNYVLGGALAAFLIGPNAPAGPIFDQIVLAAGDEIKTTFGTPNGGRMAHLSRLGRQITLYFNRDDVAMSLSRLANGVDRIGYNGPDNADDIGFFPRSIYNFIDCTGVDDYISSFINEPDRSHQYYRQSPTVRADIICTLAHANPPGRTYDPARNVSGLFHPTLVATAQSDGPNGND